MTTIRPSHNSADRFTVGAGVCVRLEGFLAENYDLELAPLAQLLGLSCDDFQSTNRKVSLDRVARLFEVVANVTGDDDIGLKYASSFELGSSGLYGYGQKNAPTLRDLFSFQVKYMPLVVDLAYLSFELDQNNARFEWVQSALIPHYAQMVSLVAALQIRHIRAGIGEHWTPQEVHLTRPTPRNPKSYHSAISPRIKFDAPVNVFKVRVEDLELCNPVADETLFKVICHQCDDALLELRSSETLLDRVMNEIATSISDPELSLQRTAHRLAVSERSLQRRLAQDNVTFNKLLDDARKNLSDQLLNGTSQPLYEIAERLGFSSTSAYTRSARRWYGKPPSEARKGRHKMPEQRS